MPRQLKRKYIVSIDVPSGICANSGKAIEQRVVDFDGGSNTHEDLRILAGLTVTFHGVKIGHLLADGAERCGKTVVVSLPLDHSVREHRRQEILRNRSKLVVHQLSSPTQSNDGLTFGYQRFCLNKQGNSEAHKYAHGHALILSGGVGKGGAARLAARGALRVGAGAVTLGAPPAAIIENAAQLNAIMLTAIKDTDALTETLQDTRINALCIGPGLGLSEKSAALVEAGLMSGRAIVLDADALTLIGRDASLFDKLHAKCILTPHAGEFARLFPDIAEKLSEPATKGPAYSKVDATRDAAKRAGCIVLFKGPDTVIADPTGRCSINASVYERSAPWLATAGSGDVLAGFITGLLARGFQPMQAAETGAWLHTECALNFGPGLIAEDLPEQLPDVFRKLGL